MAKKPCISGLVLLFSLTFIYGQDQKTAPGDSAPVTQGAGPTKIRISAGVAARNLIDRVEPSYPKLAKEAHVEGDVVLQCMISKTGDVTEIKAISGHPILIQSAVEAVKEWKYKPFLLNGEPIAVQTTVTVSFHL